MRANGSRLGNSHAEAKCRRQMKINNISHCVCLELMAASRNFDASEATATITSTKIKYSWLMRTRYSAYGHGCSSYNIYYQRLCNIERARFFRVFSAIVWLAYVIGPPYHNQMRANIVRFICLCSAQVDIRNLLESGKLNLALFPLLYGIYMSTHTCMQLWWQSG